MDASRQDTSIAIIGGGPAGLVAAIAFARRGLRSTVYERAADPATLPRVNPDRSYTIDITGHGLRALRQNLCHMASSHLHICSFENHPVLL